MKRFACGTLMDGCPGVVTGTTDDDVLAAAAAHAADVHGLTTLPDDVIAVVRAGITDASGRRPS